jgi:hypothetical protein
LRTTRSCSRRCATRARSGPGRGRVGPRCVHGNPLGKDETSELRQRMTERIKKGG